LTTILACWSAVSDVRAVDFGEAEYSIPKEPFRAVLHVTSATTDGPVKSLTLYGNGKLDLVDSVQGAFTHAVERAELERLVGEAVRHGLVELSRTPTHSMERLLTRYDGRGVPRGGVDVALYLGLDDYRRDEFRGHQPGRGVHIENLPPDTADYPRIFELQGLAKVLTWMDRMFEVAAPSGGDPTDYTAAKFGLPSDPSRVVLSLRQSSMSLTVRTVRLYGDGRLELTDGHLAEYVRYLDDADLQAVLFVAVGHGLVEYDELAIIAEKWMRFQRRPPPPTSDAGHVNVVVSVDHYEREGFEAERADNELSFVDLRGDGKYFPEVPQFRGVSMLLGWMHEQFTAAEKVFAEHGSTG
jgi:hypothetical protein